MKKRPTRTIDCPWRFLPACDLALALGPAAGGLSLLWAMAAGVPIVAHATEAVSEFVENDHSALLCRENEPWEVTRRLTRLIEDPRLVLRLKDAGRRDVYTLFAPSRYRRSIRKAYEQMSAGQPIDLPPTEAGGRALRFEPAG